MAAATQTVNPWISESMEAWHWVKPLYLSGAPAGLRLYCLQSGSTFKVIGVIGVILVDITGSVNTVPSTRIMFLVLSLRRPPLPPDGHVLGAKIPAQGPSGSAGVRGYSLHLGRKGRLCPISLLSFCSVLYSVSTSVFPSRDARCARR